MTHFHTNQCPSCLAYQQEIESCQQQKLALLQRAELAERAVKELKEALVFACPDNFSIFIRPDTIQLIEKLTI